LHIAIVRIITLRAWNSPPRCHYNTNARHTTIGAPVPQMALGKKQSYWRLIWLQYRKKPLGILGLCLIVFMGAVAIAAPFLAGDVPVYLHKDGATYWLPNIFTYDALNEGNLYDNFDRWEPKEGDAVVWPLVRMGPYRQDLRARLQPPSGEHFFGTDDRGRDVFSRMVWGTRISMSVGFLAEGIAVFIGLILGALAGFYGRWVDALILRMIEVVLIFPTFFLVIVVMAFFDKPTIWHIMVVIGITGWTGIARLVRGEFLKQKEQDYTLAARATGLRDARIIFRHILPNSLSPVFVSATFGVAGAILIESALSFLGFGVAPPTASWGELLKQSQSYVDIGVWWLVLFPGAAIFITVVGFNLVGDTLRDAMDPKLRS